MGDIQTDTLSQMAMMVEAFKELRRRDPNHELLRLIDLHDDERGFNITPEYRMRCVREGERLKIHGYTRYTFALRAAVRDEPIELLDTNPSRGY